MDQPAAPPQPEFSKTSFHVFLWESVCSNVSFTLAGGVFFTGFLLFLGASNFTIGLVSSIPLLASIAAPLFPYIINRAKSSKSITVKTMLPFKLAWFLVPLIPFLMYFRGIPMALVIFAVVFSALSLMQSFVGISWMQWMGDIIPEAKRGFYFGRRSLVGGIVGSVVGMASGRYLDLWSANQFFGFASIFTLSCVCGLACYFFQLRLPDPPERLPSGPMERTLFAGMAGALHDGNFRRLVTFNAAWMFILSLMGVYLQVYMIKELKLSYTLITIFVTVNTLVNLSLLDFWGKIIDKHGSKPAMFICGNLISFMPFLWIITGYSYWIILPLYVVGGIAWSGFGLSQFNILLKVSPPENRSSYFALNTFLVSAAAIAGQLLGGLLIDRLTFISFAFLGLHWGAFQVLFFLCGLVRFWPMQILKKVYEPQAAEINLVLRVVRGGIGMGFVEGVGVLFEYALLPAKKIGDLVGDLFEREKRGND
jgi:MFS family permease